jgi:hypothetical protein
MLRHTKDALRTFEVSYSNLYMGHALVMDGTTPDLATAQIAPKPIIDGFFASIRCEPYTPELNVELPIAKAFDGL